MSSVPTDTLPSSTPPSVTSVTLVSLCIAGIGQCVNGEVGKGLAMFALWLVLFLIWEPLVLVLNCFAAWDAYVNAKRTNDGNTELKDNDLVKIAGGEVSAEYMVAQFDKLNNLAQANVLTAEELTDRKANVIALLETKTPTSSAEDFLTALIPLVQSEGLSAAEIAKIKSLLFR